MNEGMTLTTDRPPGKYVVRVSDGGALKFLYRLSPVAQEVKQKKQQTLADIWQESKLPFETFKEELERIGKLDGNYLLLSGPQFKALIIALGKLEIIPRSLSMRKAYNLFNLVFVLRFSSARCLTGTTCSSSDAQAEQWQETFRPFLKS